MVRIFILSLLLAAYMPPLQAQVIRKLGEKAKSKVIQRADQKVDHAMDKGLDELENGGKNKEAQDQPDENPGTPTTKNAGLKSYSRYDFVPGEKILYAEDFAHDVIGEFPLKWNTNGSGEVVTIDGHPGKWLQVLEGTLYESAFKKTFPENYTIEFDLLLNFKESQAVPGITFMGFSKVNDAVNAGYNLEMNPQNGTYSSGDEQNTIDRYSFNTRLADGTSHMQAKDQLGGHLYNNQSRPVHVAIWVQKERLRAWINETKIYDLPKAIPPGLKLNQAGFEISAYGGESSNYQYYISNLKIAEGTPDTRSKLITEGRFSTTGILFDVNSDRMQPTSYGVLKEIATTLKENSDVKVKIVGHTDSDGDDAKNMDLSKRRAAAVKKALTTEFGIEASRMETDGLGETKPVADNKTPEAKAQNRRVEFVKM